MFSRQGIALAGNRCAVEFVVDGVVVVDKACFHQDPAAGGVADGVAQASQLLSVFLNQYSTTALRASVVKPLLHHALPMQ